MYYAVLGTLALFGIHRLVLLLVLRLVRPPAEVGGSVAAGAQEEAPLPRVTVQLPIYNERYVAPRLVAAVLDFDYPTERLEIQILDDSTDDTGERIEAVLEGASKRGRPLPAVRHLRRRGREGFKAGALAAGLSEARGELIAIFDADFVPGPDFLRRTAPAFADPGLGMVQARWDHMNRSDSLLTRAQAVLLDGHFLVEQEARYRSGCFFNFNGTAGVWRRRAIEEAGGWKFDTLTEDLDLSYRAQLAGWRFLLMTDLAVPADLPGRVNDFKSQQHRWARGTAQTMRKLLGRILRSPVRLRVKLAATAHLTSGFCYPLLVALGLLLLPAILQRQAVSVPAAVDRCAPVPARQRRLWPAATPPVSAGPAGRAPGRGWRCRWRCRLASACRFTTRPRSLPVCSAAAACSLVRRRSRPARETLPRCTGPTRSGASGAKPRSRSTSGSALPPPAGAAVGGPCPSFTCSRRDIA